MRPDLGAERTRDVPGRLRHLDRGRRTLAALETDFRPHFFGGVAIVVAKLLLQVLPDFAVFGEKDYQQLQVIKRMVADLNIPVEVVPGPTQREADGLALSSRNAYLDAGQRKIAGQLNLVLKDVIARVRNGKSIEHAAAFGFGELLAAGFDKVDYLEIRDAETLAHAEDRARPLRVLAAAKIGATRLIDNTGGLKKTEFAEGLLKILRQVGFAALQVARRRRPSGSASPGRRAGPGATRARSRDR